MRKNGKFHMSPEEENYFFATVDVHYFRSPAITGIQSTELKEMARNEVSQFLNRLSHDGLLQYMMEFWYDDFTWEIWARRHSSKVPFSRTTMKVEAQWSNLKLLYHLSYNRPRVDLLVFTISARLIPKFVSDYDALNLGLQMASWWRSFVKAWKQAQKNSQNSVVGEYDTNKSLFICSCGSWLRSQYFIWKHLVYKEDCPFYGQ